MKKYSLIVILSIPMLLLISVFLYLDGGVELSQQLAKKLTFTLSTEEGINTTIRCWEDENGELVVFLPSYTKLGALTMEPCGSGHIKLNGAEIKRKTDCSQFELNKKYSISDGSDETTIRFIQSANVATMFVETETGTMDYIHKDKAHKENAEIQIFAENGALEYRGDGLDQIRGHGNSTWTLDKKAYNVYLSNETDLLHIDRKSVV